LSVDAVQVSPICVLDEAVATRLLGAVGACVSAAALVLADATFEYPPRFPAASAARTRYEYEVEAVSPLSLNVVAPVVVPTCTNELQLPPLQRSIRYPVTPTLSVDAVQVNPICELDEALAARLLGADGGVVSVDAVVVAGAILEYALRFPAASAARTR
jgi:hypothetical protein